MGNQFNIGDKRINKTWHPDGGCFCWEAQKLTASNGRFASKNQTYWRSLTLEPFATKEEAEEYLVIYGQE